ncbi:uncharacterized protein LOC116428328 [Nomia melanderi]|uniref:uncharacterized protein LOC116428328 n=1 Tax=Nomia melanderi TaxID=2448451 RepID=UPI0013044389|nr:uncharacterized protein LOC116428328 [Nomia melanderi]XP_031835668.1 uncharacterized protein LOC116428328 [Nomia melanderi]
MTGRSSAKRTGLCLLTLLLFCLSNGNVLVVGDPGPIPSELLYSEAFLNNAENLILMKKLKQVIEEKKNVVEREKELDDMQIMIESVLEPRIKDKPSTRVDYSAEEFRTPNTVMRQTQREGKRTPLTYTMLCHFKICNMGRKRQLHK